MSNIYAIQYEVCPAPNSVEFGLVGGAFVNCLIAADTETEAMNAANRFFQENHWSALSVVDEPYAVERENYMDDPEWLDYFDEAVTSGACYIFHQWPPEPQEEDTVH